MKLKYLLIILVLACGGFFICFYLIQKETEENINQYFRRQLEKDSLLHQNAGKLPDSCECGIVMDTTKPNLTFVTIATPSRVTSSSTHAYWDSSKNFKPRPPHPHPHWIAGTGPLDEQDDDTTLTNVKPKYLPRLSAISFNVQGDDTVKWKPKYYLGGMLISQEFYLNTKTIAILSDFMLYRSYCRQY